MGKTAIHLVYTSDTGRKFTAGVLDNPPLIREISEQIIQENKREAAEIAGDDPVLGQIKGDEVQRLERVLQAIVPGLIVLAEQ